jgi:hypothetical protein
LTPRGLLAKAPQPSSGIEKLVDQVVLTQYNAGEDAGHMVKAEFQVQNTSDQDVRNITVSCDFFDETGRYLDNKMWLIDGVVPAGKTIQQVFVDKRYVNTRAMALNCKIVDLKAAVTPLFALHRAAESGHGEGEKAEHGMSSGHNMH